MIGELLRVNGIRHIISVDDCYMNVDIDKIKAALFAGMQESFAPYETIVKEMGQEQLFEETRNLLNLTEEKDTIISDFLENFTETELQKLYEANNESLKNMLQEKNLLIEFLESLKNNGDIEGFELISSTKDALESEYIKHAEKTEGILWLIDQNFSGVGESENAGLELAKTIVGREDGPSNFVYILSAIRRDNGGDDDSIEKEFDSYLQNFTDLKETSFVYFIYKQRIKPDNTNKIAEALAQGFKRKVCYELFDLYISSLRTSIEDSSEKLYTVRQDTLNFLLDEMVKKNGESYLEFLGRFVKIFQGDFYQKALANNYSKIAEKVHYYKKISDVAQKVVGNQKGETEKVKEFRKIELYNYHINEQHFEISTGDIFKIKEKYYVLVSQVCDTCLRDNGGRVLREAVLLLIKDDNSTVFTYPLSCFDEYKIPKVKFRFQLNFPFEILDLCVLHEDGRASVPLYDLENINEDYFRLFTNRYCKRMMTVFPELQKMLRSTQLVENFFSGKNTVDKDAAQAAYNYCKGLRPELLDYKVCESELCYDVQRVCRLEELISADIVNKFGINVSRMGSAFDFTSWTHRNEKP